MDKKSIPPLGHFAKISGIYLTKSNFEITASNFDNIAQDKEKSQGTLQFRASLEGNIIPNEDQSSGHLTGSIDVTVTGITKSEEPIFRFDVTFEAFYQLDELHPWAEAEIQHFIHRNMLNHIWPYVREHIDTTTQKAPIPRVTLPLVPISPKRVPAPEDTEADE